MREQQLRELGVASDALQAALDALYHAWLASGVETEAERFAEESIRDASKNAREALRFVREAKRHIGKAGGDA